MGERIMYAMSTGQDFKTERLRRRRSDDPAERLAGIKVNCYAIW